MAKEPLYELSRLKTESQTLNALEQGQVIFLPKNGFQLKKHEEIVLTPKLLQPRKKNISFDYKKQCISGLHYQFSNTPCRAYTQQMMHRFAEYAKYTITTLFPEYENHLIWGRSSYRPAVVENRYASKLKDDSKLHVDSFVATPVAGLRILRVFSNINPHEQSRVWHIGDSFQNVLNHFEAHLPPYRPHVAKILKHLKITKSLRTPYDHYMLKLHNQMKLDENYQAQVHKHEIHFPSGSSWVVFSDQVSHAALSGQYLLEQTFYLPTHAMQHPQYSPLNQLQAIRPQINMI